MKWFKHDTDASIDAKLQELLLDYGAKGYGMYWYCVELIAKNVTPKNITFELEHDARIIARTLGLDQREAQDIMRKMVELGLFDFGNNDKLRCVALAYRLDDFTRKGVDTNQILSNFYASQKSIGQSTDNVGSESDKVRADKIRKDKNREDKKREEEELEQTREEFEIFWKEYPKKKSKDTALKAFIKNHNKLPSIDELIQIVKANKSTDDWQKSNGQFIPYPATWLNAGGYKDELQRATGKLWDDETEFAEIEA